MSEGIAAKKPQKSKSDWKKFDWKRFGFMASILAIPIINFFVFTIGGLGTTIGLGFFGYNEKTQTTYWNNFQNFIDVINQLKSGAFGHYFLISFIWYLISWFNMIGSYAIAFYIYKKNPLGGFFRSLYFMPSLITGIIWAGLFKFLVREPGLYRIFGAEYGLLAMPQTAIQTLCFYSIWMGLCGGVLTTVGFMSGISPELVDASKIDGCNGFQEFIHVTMPALWPFLSIGIYTGVVSLFMSGPPLYDFWGTSAHEDLKSFSYYLLCTVMKDPTNKSYQMYSAAASLLVTCIVAPLTFLSKHFVLKLGPKEE